ncbi:MAG: succinate dehydrogenase cytochrome b subunit [Myxococcaceae bacterium]|jgi:succinate dehydrogenase / fumarate reductase cytochrome b subunit|nr:succinate dehydrogenase cytochrome b subunit [Myxococcaceae bacterium]MCA3013728.1 succinate dehydrogenase cytochrome b subunit [Myxococcaceae bacterium]
MSEAAELKRDDTVEPLFGSLVKFARSSVGSKVVMALTGVVLWGFVMGHLAGNLLAFLGRDAFNAYAAALKGNPPLLWGTRLTLMLCVPVHFYFAFRSSRANADARPVAYAYENKTPARLASKTMMLSGLVVGTFLLYHLAHFTLRLVNVTAAKGPGGDFSPFDMLVEGFKNPLIALIYIAGQLLLAQHLSHGISSLFQHLGLWGRRFSPWLKRAALVVGYGLCAAFITIPVSVLLGVIK